MSQRPPPDGYVYLVEDDAAVREGCVQALSIAGIPVRDFVDGESLLRAVQEVTPALVVTDVRLPGCDGLQLLREVRRHNRETAVLLMTGHGDVNMAVHAMREGAFDFIEKPFPSERLISAVKSALAKHSLLTENRQLRQRLGCESIVGQSAAIERVRELVNTLGPTQVDMLIRGETGAGKEVVARAIHAASGRSGPFVALNCGALPESMFESELFGHEAGAFTGAVKRRIGRIEHACGGTLFLDEIESMPLNLQVKLLRVLQERCVERLGSNKVIPIDCRWLVASKADLKVLSDAGQFRADLYYRLNVVTLDLPSLRERTEDIPLLMAHFLRLAAERFGRPVADWTPSDLARWQAHAWPGNVRELKSVSERWALGLPDGLPQGDWSVGRGALTPLSAQVDAAERRIIQATLSLCRGNVAKAAEQLQTPRKTLYDKLNRYSISPEAFR